MMWISKGCGRLALILGVFVWVAPASGWAGALNKVPGEARLRKAEELKAEYERLYGEKKYGEAAAVAERTCAILAEELGRQSLKLATCLNDMASLHRLHGNYRKAEPLYMRALGIREKALGPDHLDVALSLNDLASLYEAQAAYGKAETLYERALGIREKALGPDHPDVAQSLNNLGSLYDAQGAYRKAESVYERALGIRERALGPDHPDVALCLNSLAVLHQHQGAYGRAKLLYERSLGIWEKALGSDHFYVAIGLNNLATLYQYAGKYDEAGLLFERALGIYEKALGSNHPAVAECLNNLATLYHYKGDDNKAEPLFERALGIREKALGPDHPQVGTSLSNLALLYGAQGAYGKAEPLLELARGIKEKALGPEHPDVALSLNNLAALYDEQGAYSKAEPLLEQALDIREKALGPEHPDIAMSLNDLALLYMRQGAYDRAGVLLGRALGIREAALGSDHPDVALSLHNLAALYQYQGEYGKAESLVTRALVIYEKALGPGHPYVAKSLNHLAKLYDDQGKHHASVMLRRRAFNIEEINLVRTLTVADEARRLAYASILSDSLHYASSLHLRVNRKHGPVAELALTTLLRRKHRVQDLIAQSNAVLRRSLTEDDQHLLDDLADIDSQVAVQSARGPGKLGVEAFSQELYELGQERNRLWSELAKHSDFVQSLDLPITIEGVQRAIPDGGALVELIQYIPRHGDDGKLLRPHEPKPAPRYAAYLVFPDHFDWVDLGPAAPIDEHVKAFRNALQTKQPIPVDLYNTVMRPIIEKLDSAHHLNIAPAGDLSLIPFGALHDGKQYLIEQYDLRYITTGRDLLAPPATPPVTTTPVTIVANPTGANLPDAEVEADFLAGLFPHTRVLLDNRATETNVRTIERPLVLHMATHGFFGEALNERDNPLFRSGLYLADIDQVEVDRERDDGQLTAYEVSGMDLRGTQLVVLSACETGMGATDVRKTDVGGVDMNEGVFGLRRAFAMAGARTTVMSLWEVSGATTQKTMEAYYRKLAEGMGRGEAMQAVQLELLHTAEHAHPKDWAAFIVSGDDTPMVFPKGEEPRIEKEPQTPPSVPRPLGCTMAAPSPADHPSVPAFLLGLLALGTLRRRRAS